MSISLKDKQAFFERLHACANCNDEEDALDAKEQALRQRSKAFFPSAAQVSPLLSSKLRQIGSFLRTAASDAGPSPADNESEIITATPKCDDSMVIASSKTPGDTTIPETERPSKKRAARGAASLPSGRVSGSQADDVQSPSVPMTKRKRTKPPAKPEPEQIFKGFRFFYVPNDDINPARKRKITKAREHGATWTRDPAEATHVIVDKGLSYNDIKSILDASLTSSSSVLVNEDYPIECITRHLVFDPKLTVEKHRFGVPGCPDLIEETALPQSSIQDSDKSLQIKSRRDALSEADTTSQLTQEDDTPVPASQPQGAGSSELATEKTGNSASGADNEPSGVAQAPALTDELNACINAVLDNPEEHKYLDDSGSDKRGSESEGPSEKKGKRGQKGKKKDAKNNSDKDIYICMMGGTKTTKGSSPNAETIKLLEEMVEELSLRNEVWRIHSYRKAITTLKQQTKKITTAKEAAALPAIGSSIADHIEEIVSTGRFQKLEQFRTEPSREALKIFCNVYGVGVATAKKWVDQGYRTLDDLRSEAKLTTNQKIGLEHYDDLLTRIPRHEVAALGDCVREVGGTIDPEVEFIIAGSYRRGGESSSDIDLIVTKKGTSSIQDLAPFLDKLTETLTAQGFLTAALASRRHEDGNKWQGCCVLPEAKFSGPKEDYRPIWRRIDFLIVPDSEIGAALLYFTGNDIFNRSMRLLAIRKNMKLNHKELVGPGVQEGKDERKIFDILGVKWREPHERWC